MDAEELLIYAKMQLDAALRQIEVATKAGDVARIKRLRERVADCEAIINDLKESLPDVGE